MERSMTRKRVYQHQHHDLRELANSASFFVDSLKRGNRRPFFGGTENSLSHVVAAQHIVEVTCV